MGNTVDARLSNLFLKLSTTDIDAVEGEYESCGKDGITYKITVKDIITSEILTDNDKRSYNETVVSLKCGSMLSSHLKMASPHPSDLKFRNTSSY